MRQQILQNWINQQTKLFSMWATLQLFTGGPIDLRLTCRSYILDALFRDTSLYHITPKCASWIPYLSAYLRAKYGVKLGIPEKIIQNVAQTTKKNSAQFKFPKKVFYKSMKANWMLLWLILSEKLWMLSWTYCWNLVFQRSAKSLFVLQAPLTYLQLAFVWSPQTFHPHLQLFPLQNE